MKKTFLGSAVLLIVGFIAYHNSFKGPFIFDDIRSIVENTHITHLWPLWDAMAAPLQSAVAGRPFVCLSLAINYWIGGLHVEGYHILNLTVHLMTSLLLFGVIKQTLCTPYFKEKFKHSSFYLAFASALIWMVHPLLTESVDYVIQRTELWMGFFLLLTLYCSIRGCNSIHRKSWCVMAIVACILGMGSKEVMAVAPLLVVLYDRTFLFSSYSVAWQQRKKLYISLVCCLMILIPLILTGQSRTGPTGFGFKNLTPFDYAITQAGVILHYIKLSFWPHPLVIDYYDWPIANSVMNVLPSVFIVVVLLIATMGSLYFSKPIGFLGAWFFLILAPTSSFLPIITEVVAERRMYLPLMAIVSGSVVCGYTVIGLYLDRLFYRKVKIGLEICFVILIITIFGYHTWLRNEQYHSAISIWKDAVLKRPNNVRAHTYLGAALGIEGKITEAIDHYQTALRLNPNFEHAYYSLGITLASEGKFSEAIGCYSKALQIRPNYGYAHYALANSLVELDRPTEAIDHYIQALKLRPEDSLARYNLGCLLIKIGQPKIAEFHYKEALRYTPNYAEAHNNLAVLLVSEGKIQEGIFHFLETIRINPHHTEAQQNLKLILEKVENK